LEKNFFLQKLKTKIKDANVILLEKLTAGYIGITVEDFVEMLNWIQSAPTPEEIKKRWFESGYIPHFEKWLADGLIKPEEMKVIFGSEKPWQ